MRYLLATIALILSTSAFASIPSLGSTGSGSEVRTAAGSTCKSGTQRTTFDAGVVSRNFNSMQQDNLNPFGFVSQMPQETGMVYARVTIPLGAKKDRLDCTRMYNLELERMQDENALLRQQLESLRNSAVVVSVE